MLLNLSYLYRDTWTTPGKERLFVRRNGRKIRIHATPGTEEFAKAYAAALEGVKIPKPKKPPAPSVKAPKHSTFGWLAMKYFASEEFKALDPKSQRVRRNIIEDCLEHKHKGEPLRDCPLRLMTPAKFKALRNEKVKEGKKGAANNRRKYLSSMFGWAIEELEGNHVLSNPVRDVRRVKYATDGYHTWTVEEVDRFIDRHPKGTKAYLALALFLYLGVRRGDVVKIGKQHLSKAIVRGGKITFVVAKGRYKKLTPSTKPILNVLADAIEAGPCGDLTFLVTSHGKSFTPAGFGNWFADRCVEAGVPGRAHGLRKAGATKAAENGATVHQLMAIFDWARPEQAEPYTRAADRKRLAASGMELLA